MDYLWIVLADVLMATDFSLNKVYQRKCGATPAAGYRFNFFSGILKMLIFWAINGFSIEITSYSAIMTAMMAFVCFSYILLGQQILKVSQVAVYTLFLMLGGMCVPYIWGATVLHEQLTLFRVIGLIVIAAALILMNLSERPPKKQLLMCIAVFILNGFCSVISKEHQISANKTVSAAGFVMLTGAATAFFGLVGIIAERMKGHSTEPVYGGAGLGAVALSAVIGGASYLLQLIGAERIPATALYPMLSGGSIALSVLTGWLFFREKPAKRLWIGMIFCIIGTAMFIF